MTQPQPPATERERSVVAFVAWFTTLQGFMAMYEHHYRLLYGKSGPRKGLKMQAYEQTEALRELWGLSRAYQCKETFEDVRAVYRSRPRKKP